MKDGDICETCDEGTVFCIGSGGTEEICRGLLDAIGKPWCNVHDAPAPHTRIDWYKCRNQYCGMEYTISPLTQCL